MVHTNIETKESGTSPLRPLLLYVYNPNVRPECQVEAQVAISQLAAAGYDVEKVVAVDMWDYFLAFATRWGQRDIINIEQDIAPTVSQVAALAACSQAACTVPYHLKNGNWSLYDIYHQEVVSYTSPGDWAGGSGLGLVKITASAQRYLRLGDPIEWWQMDIHLSRLMGYNGLQWHVHEGPVRHVRPNVD